MGREQDLGAWDVHTSSAQLENQWFRTTAFRGSHELVNITLGKPAQEAENKGLYCEAGEPSREPSRVEAGRLAGCLLQVCREFTPGVEISLRTFFFPIMQSQAV